MCVPGTRAATRPPGCAANHGRGTEGTARVSVVEQCTGTAATLEIRVKRGCGEFLTVYHTPL
jgi:hypothetical protein